ncbi:MAG: MBL fold metallo-hydrolase [Bacteroidales bacterium]|nr:MBL fold metallo-hydrolase [Bacteroidales bacterium]
MRISAVIENTSRCGLQVEHGLCLWIEACGRRFFFDLGQGCLFADNAKVMGIDPVGAEFVIISHGHYDHGGGIGKFLEINDHAPVYLHRKAFTDCYSLKEAGPKYIGLKKELQENPRIIPTEGVIEISKGLILFSGCEGHDFFSPANKRILKQVGGDLLVDDFAHEQSLIISEGNRRVLIAGCAHSGLLNIMRRAERILGESLTDAITGMHLTGVTDTAFITGFAAELSHHPCHYYTCHCTGHDAYQQLKSLLADQITYLSCGDILEL